MLTVCVLHWNICSKLAAASRVGSLASVTSPHKPQLLSEGHAGLHNDISIKLHNMQSM